jgi:hypothetical protein
MAGLCVEVTDLAGVRAALAVWVDGQVAAFILQGSIAGQAGAELMVAGNPEAWRLLA